MSTGSSGAGVTAPASAIDSAWHGHSGARSNVSSAMVMARLVQVQHQRHQGDRIQAQVMAKPRRRTKGRHARAGHRTGQDRADAVLHVLWGGDGAGSVMRGPPTGISARARRAILPFAPRGRAGRRTRRTGRWRGDSRAPDGHPAAPRRCRRNRQVPGADARRGPGRRMPPASVMPAGSGPRPRYGRDRRSGPRHRSPRPGARQRSGGRGRRHAQIAGLQPVAPAAWTETGPGASPPACRRTCGRGRPISSGRSGFLGDGQASRLGTAVLLEQVARGPADRVKPRLRQHRPRRHQPRAAPAPRPTAPAHAAAAVRHRSSGSRKLGQLAQDGARVGVVQHHRSMSPCLSDQHPGDQSIGMVIGAAITGVIPAACGKACR